MPDSLGRDDLRLVVDTIPAMAWSVLPDGKVDFVNHYWREYTGLSLQEALAQPNGVVHPDDLASVMDSWRHSMDRGEPYEAEMRLRGADGQYRWFLVRTDPMWSPEGEILKWYGTSIAVEDRQRAGDAMSSDPRRVLSLRELMVLKLVAQGMTSREVAASIGIMRSTVDTYRCRIMEKLEVKRVAGLVRLAIRHGLVKP
jgi:PAS domain S-box-containing protein